jgi:hypothetical protein
MNLQLSSRRPAPLALAVACCVLWTESPVLGQAYRAFRDVSGRFELEYPTRDWNPLPAAGSAIAILVRNDRTATVVVDHTRLTEPLAPAEIATNARIEVESLKAQPNAKDFTSEILEGRAGRGSLIRYGRQGASGPERVMRYSVAVGRDLYRVDAVVPEGSLAKHEAILKHMILSLKVPANPAKD